MAGINWTDPLKALKQLGDAAQTGIKALDTPGKAIAQTWDDAGNTLSNLNWQQVTGIDPNGALAQGLSGAAKSIGNQASNVTGGGSSNPSQPWDPTDQIRQFLNQYDLSPDTTPDAIVNYLKNQAGGSKDLANQTSLSTALTALAKNENWQPKFLGAGANAGNIPSSWAQILDPTSVQLFFQNSIAPFLSKVGQDEQNVAKQYSQIDTSNLPPGYAAMMNAQNKQAGLDVEASGDANAAAMATQPRLDMLTQMLGLIQTAQQNSYAEQIRNGVASGTNPFGL